jgi:hypothetical protein
MFFNNYAELNTGLGFNKSSEKANKSLISHQGHTNQIRQQSRAGANKFNKSNKSSGGFLPYDIHARRSIRGDLLNLLDLLNYIYSNYTHLAHFNKAVLPSNKSGERLISHFKPTSLLRFIPKHYGLKSIVPSLGGQVLWGSASLAPHKLPLSSPWQHAMPTSMAANRQHLHYGL